MAPTVCANVSNRARTASAGKHSWKVVRAAEGAGLENRCAVTPYRRFESYTFRSVAKGRIPA